MSLIGSWSKRSNGAPLRFFWKCTKIKSNYISHLLMKTPQLHQPAHFLCQNKQKSRIFVLTAFSFKNNTLLFKNNMFCLKTSVFVKNNIFCLKTQFFVKKNNHFLFKNNIFFQKCCFGLKHVVCKNKNSVFVQ